MAENPAKRRRIMSHGVIDGISEDVEVKWKIPDFFLLNLDKNEFIESPPFSFAGYKWMLTVYPKGDGIDGYMSAYLSSNDPNTATKLASFSIAFRTENGILVEETEIDQHAFNGKSTWGWADFLNLTNLMYQLAEAAGSPVTFTCRIKHETDFTTVEAGSFYEEVDYQRTTLVGLESLSSDFKDLLSSYRKSDVTIDVQGKEFRAHRTMLKARSTVFRAMYEFDSSEAKCGVLKIPDCDPESFGDFISFLYTGRLELDSYSVAYHLYTTADKYDVQQLKFFCTDYLRQNLTTENVTEIAELADMHSDDTLMSSAQAFFNVNYKKIFRKPNWKAMMKNNPRLAKELKYRRAQKTASSAVTFTCGMGREADSTTVEASPYSEEVDYKQTTLMGLETLSSDFKYLLSSDNKCDATIDVQGKEFRAHRTVLAARSSIFRTIYEQDNFEDKSGILKIPDCDPETFGDFIRFLYTGRLELNSFSVASHLFATADKYDVQQLKFFCTDYLRQNLTTENVTEIAELADQHGDGTLVYSAQVFFNENYKQIFRLSSWKAMMRRKPRIANKLLEDMASAAE